MLNSSYGKTCEGFHNTKTVIKNLDETFDYMFKNFNTVIEGK